MKLSALLSKQTFFTLFFNVIILSFSYCQIDLMLDNQLCMSNEVKVIVTTEIDVQSYKWNGPSIIDDTEINVTINGPGIYTLTIVPTDNSSSQSATIEVLDIPVEDFAINSSITLTCTDKISELTTSIIDTSLYSYKWTSDIGSILGTSGTLEARFAGTYTLEITNALGCTKTNNVEVFADIPAHDFKIEMDSLTCDEVGKLYITSSDNIIAVNWTGPLGFNSAEQNPNISVVGFYKAKVTFSDSCQVEKNIRADYLHFAPDIEFTGNVINCDYPEVRVIENTNTDYKYEWKSLFGTFRSDEAEPLISERGIYEIKILDQVGCEAIYYANVKIDTTVARFDIITEEVNCDNPSTILDYNYNANNFQSYEWSGPGINDDNRNIEKPSVLEEGIYTIKGKTQNGCPFERKESVLKDIEPINITNSNTDEVIDCNNPLQVLTAETDRDADRFQWFFQGNLISNEKTINADKTGNYRAVAIGSNGCKDKIDFSVTGDIQLPIFKDNSQKFINCKDSIAIINIELTDATGGANYSYQWESNPTNTPTPTQLVFETTVAGNYILTSENISNGCLRNDTITVIEDIIVPVTEIYADTIDCKNQESLVRIISDTLDFEFSWTSENGIIENVSEIYSNGEEDIILKTIGSNACVSFDTIMIVKDTISPTFAITSDEVIGCDINDLIIKTETSNNANFSFAWSTMDGEISSVTDQDYITVEKEGVYTLIVKDNKNNCEDLDSVSIERGESNLNSIDIEIFDPKCSNDADGQIVVNSIEGATGIVSYAINENQNFISDAIFENLTSGEYLVKALDSSGCSFDTIIQLEAGHTIELKAIDAITVDEGESITIETTLNQSGEEINYSWKGIEIIGCDTCNMITIDAYESQRITVIGEDEHGCTDEANIDIFVNDLPDIWLANIFSPSALDPINQTLPIYIAPFVEIVSSISCYDRYGNQVVGLSDISPEEIGIIWDGKYNGQNAIDGVYAFRIEYIHKSGKQLSVTQSVTIVN